MSTETNSQEALPPYWFNSLSILMAVVGAGFCIYWAGQGIDWTCKAVYSGHKSEWEIANLKTNIASVQKWVDTREDFLINIIIDRNNKVDALERTMNDMLASLKADLAKKQDRVSQYPIWDGKALAYSTHDWETIIHTNGYCSNCAPIDYSKTNAIRHK